MFIVKGQNQSVLREDENSNVSSGRITRIPMFLTIGPEF